MNVWLVKAYEPLPIPGQKQRLFRMGILANALAEKGHKVTWFSTTFDHFSKEQLYEEDQKIEVNKNLTLEVLWSPAYKKNISVERIINHMFLANKLKKRMNELEKPDLIYVSFPIIDLAEIAINYGQKNNIPVIIDIRDLWPDIFKHNLSGIKRIVAIPYIKLMDYKTRKIMKKAYAINTISPKFLEWGMKKAGREAKENDKVFYIGYSHEEKPIDKAVEETVKINKETFNLCFFGTLNNQFRFDKIVEIAKLLQGQKVNIYVCGTGENYDYLNEEASKLDNLKLLGWLNKEQLQYVLSNSQIGIAPYKPTFDFQMNIPNKFAEYLAYGLPVILTSGGYMGELIDKNEVGINSNNEEEIAKYIIKLTEDKNMYKKTSEKAKKLYEKDFVAEKIYPELVNYLERIGDRKK